jgi:hypothetical protein
VQRFQVGVVAGDLPDVLFSDTSVWSINSDPSIPLCYLPKQMAVYLFQNAAIGTQVSIRRESPHDDAPNPLASESHSPLTSIMDR